MIGTGQAEHPDFVETGAFDAAIDHVGDSGGGPLAHRPGDHARLAEPAAAGAAAEDFHTHAFVDGFRDRHHRLFRIRPLVEVHQSVLADLPRHAGGVRANLVDLTVWAVFDVVERRHIHLPGGGQGAQQSVAAVWAALAFPVRDQFADPQHRLLTVTKHRSVDERGQRFGVEGRVTAHQHQRIVDVTIRRP